jgi:aminopeptidase N
MRGLYRSSYYCDDDDDAHDGDHGDNKKKKKKRRWIVSTQMEPTDARRAFPCWDEPALKATFRVRVTVPAHLTCLSNAPAESSHSRRCPETKRRVKTVAFGTTPRMSTYLVALVVGQFDSISMTAGALPPTLPFAPPSPPASAPLPSDAMTAQAVTTTVYTVPGRARRARFCLETASRCLSLFQALFGVPYPLAKNDLVAVPDFAAG